MSLIEVIITALLLGLSMSAIGELVLVNTIASTRLTNNIDGQTGCSRALRRMTQDIRAAQSFTISTTAAGQTLSLQLPVYTNATNDPVAGFPKNVYPDQVVYSVVADPTNIGTYDLTLQRTTSDPLDGRQVIGAPGEIMLTGIVGPTQIANGVPTVFSYLSVANNQSPYLISPPTQQTPYVGVYINLQVQTPPNGFGTNVRIVGTHVEAYLKASAALNNGIN